MASKKYKCDVCGKESSSSAKSAPSCCGRRMKASRR